ncbi:MAG TPA: high-potential iron-sulfur protein, partial [Burkholderiaceae bacterium]
YVGEPGQAHGGCSLFYGKDVAAKAWCSAWEKKPG